MGNAIISRRGGGYATVKFENYGTLPLPTRSTPAVLSQARDPAATTSGDYALFGGGTSSTSIPFFKSAVVDVYSGSLAKTTVTSLSQARCELAATTVGDYALFGGGYYYDYNNSKSTSLSTVDTYTSNLVKGTASSLSTARQCLGATTVGNYALFGGGYSYNTSSASSAVDAYNNSLTRSSPATLSIALEDVGATTVGDYALLASKTYDSPIVDAYTSNLAKSAVTELSEARYGLAATTVGNYALIGGGGTAVATVDVYYSPNTLDFMVYKNSKYKFQNMAEEVTVTENMKNITVPIPATGYIKVKNTTIS